MVIVNASRSQSCVERLVVPLVLQRQPRSRTGAKDFGDFLLKSRRIAIFVIMVMAYFYYRALGNTQLAAIGLLSFAAIAQLAPAFFGGLFWRRATARGAIGGMLAGFATWLYTLFLPSFLDKRHRGRVAVAARSVRHRGAAAAGAVRRGSAAAVCTACSGALSLNILTYVVLSRARSASRSNGCRQPACSCLTRWRDDADVRRGAPR